jgi:hypothetical protein
VRQVGYLIESSVNVTGLCSKRAFRNPSVGKQHKSLFTDPKLFCASIISGTDSVHVKVKYMENNNELT